LALTAGAITYFNNGFGWNNPYYGGFGWNNAFGNGFDGAIHSDLDMEFGYGDLASVCYGGFGWNNPYYGYNNFMVVKDITETTLYNAGRRGSINTNDNTNRNFSSRNNNITN
jgi:hypothetical protein